MPVFSCFCRCAGWVQRDHLRLRTDVLREDTHHGGEAIQYTRYTQHKQKPAISLQITEKKNV